MWVSLYHHLLGENGWQVIRVMIGIVTTVVLIELFVVSVFVLGFVITILEQVRCSVIDIIRTKLTL